jgi:G6PDH family F420-dependent oxidoreductase
MPQYGLKLMTEIHGPSTLVEQAVAAEDAGFDLVSMSDHYLPWLPEHEHSPFAWSVLGAVAQATDRVQITTGVTCPILRYHPAIVAQAAATVAELSDDRFTLALGAGERLNEHVTGIPFPPLEQRHEMLAEAVDLMRALWTGEVVNRRGEHFTVDDARIYEVPEEPIDVVLAVSGDASLDLAKRVGADGIMAVDPSSELVDGWADRGGDRAATWTEVPFAWAPTAEEGERLAHERFRFGAPGWPVMSELPNPTAFDAATESVRPEDLADSVPSGPDPERYVTAVQQFLDAGFEKVSVVPVGDDLDGFLAFWEDLRPQLP